MLDVAVQSIGVALLHSVWQGALVGGATAMALKALGGVRPSVRYLVACTGLALMVTAWTVTAWQTAAGFASEGPTAAGRAEVAAPPLGPGTFDVSPAIRPISREALETPTPSWRYRLEAWSATVVPVWLLGVCALSVRLAGGWLRLARVRRGILIPVTDAVATRARELAGLLGISRGIRVAQSANMPVPAVVGWLRPLILLPASAVTGLSPSHLDAILAHELAHVRRHDFAMNILQTAAEILLFYHPACWWISRRIRAEREYCCDDMAISLCGDRLGYATALAELETMRGHGALALAATGGPLQRRVRRLLSPSAAPRPSGWMAAAVPIALVVSVVVGPSLMGPAAAILAAQNQPSAQGKGIPAGSGVIRGQIVDALSGRPVPDASYEITGEMDAGGGRTDENGRFETRPIKAGRYTLSVRAKGYVTAWYGPREQPFGTPIDVRSGMVSAGIDVKLYAAGAINGRILGDKGEGLQGVEIVLEPLRSVAYGERPGARQGAVFAQTIENGVYHASAAPGDYYVRAYIGDPLPPDKGGRRSVYVSTFYPGVRVMEEGQPLRIEAGLDLHDIDFTLATASLLRIRGTVVDPSGDSLEGLRVAVMAIGATVRSRQQSAGLDGEGRFEIRDLTPGDYMLQVWDPRRTSRWVGSMKHLRLDADVDDVEMRATVGAQIVGRVVRDPASTRPLDMSDVHVEFEKQANGSGLTFSGGARVEADGSFQADSPGGLVTIDVNYLPDGWTVKSVYLDRVDVNGQAVDLTGGRRELEIVLTDTPSTVSGVVVDRNGRPLGGYSVVLFSEDETRWTPSSRFLLEARSSQTGQFRLRDVPPGSYLAIAARGLPFRAWTNPDVLLRLQSLASTLRVAEGEQKTISIRASAIPDDIAVR
jgi:beta-lactamase regulating signal transducer with metallopeptidase domain